MEAPRHCSLRMLEERLSFMEAAPKSHGSVLMIVRRPTPGGREILQSAELTPEMGIPGHLWGRQPPGNPDAQLAVMNGAMARLIANGQPLTVFGDNLFVDLDLSATNLPTGSRLRVGEATVEVTPMPHNGCAKFRERFGDAALRFVEERATRHENRRGVYWRVIEGGAIAVGVRIEVLSRPGT